MSRSERIEPVTIERRVAVYRCDGCLTDAGLQTQHAMTIGTTLLEWPPAGWVHLSETGVYDKATCLVTVTRHDFCSWACLGRYVRERVRGEEG